jgi:putative DNA primase/helicase
LVVTMSVSTAFDLVEIDDYYIFAETYVAEWEGTPRCLHAALAYARNWKVFPAPRGEKKSHKSAKRSGGINWGATKDPNQIHRDFEQWPLANVGVPTGIDNDIWVMEVDTKEGHGVDGVASLRSLIEQHGELPKTLTAESPSGSLHFYFKWPAVVVVGNSTSKIAPGIDVRGEGGMVIAPPSVKPPVGCYSWTSNVEPVEAPRWLLELALEAGNGGGRNGEHNPNPDLEAPLPIVEAAVNVIPNPDLDHDAWKTHGMAIFAASRGSAEGFILFDRFSKKSQKYEAAYTMEAWQSLHRSPPNRIGFGSLHHWACEAEPNWANDYDDQVTSRLDAAAHDEGLHEYILAEMEAEAAGDVVVSLEEARESRDNNHHAKTNGKAETKEEDRQEQASNLHVVRVSEVAAKAYNWLWKSRIARGKVTLLVGMPDVNKSTLALDLTARITKADVLPAGEGRAPLGNVIILSAEDDVADTIRPRLEVAGADLDRVHVITAVKINQKGGRRTFDLTRDIAQLEMLVNSISDVVMIIIDPYSAYMGKPGKLDSYRSTDVRATLAPLFDMASRLDVAVLGIGHLNKSGSMPALLRVLDSVAFVAASRGVYLVTRDPEQKDRRLFVPAKNNIGRNHAGLAFTIYDKLATTVFDNYPAIKWEDGTVDITADDALAWREDGRRSVTKEQAKNLIREMLANGSMKQQDVQARAEEQGITARVLNTAKKDLGVVSSRADGAWWWTLPGQPPAF